MMDNQEQVLSEPNNDNEQIQPESNYNNEQNKSEPNYNSEEIQIETKSYLKYLQYCLSLAVE